MKFIVSVDENNDFLSFINPLIKYYKDINFDLDILILSENKKLIKKFNKFENVYFFRPEESIDSGIQSKVLRHYYCCTLADETLVVTDADQFILNLSKLENSIKEMNNIVGFGKNIFDNTDLDGKTPMAPYITTPKLSRELLGINESTSFGNFLNILSQIDIEIDGKESINNKFENFSDESLFRLLKKINNVVFENVDIHLNLDGDRRIDRTEKWNIQNPNIGKYFWKRVYLNSKQKKDITNKIYFDLCPPRPNPRFITSSILKQAAKVNKKL